MDAAQTRQICFVLLSKTWSKAAMRLTIYSLRNAEGVADDFFRSPCTHERTLKYSWNRRSPLTSFPSIYAGMLEQKCRGQLFKVNGVSHTASAWWRGTLSVVGNVFFSLQLVSLDMWHIQCWCFPQHDKPSQSRLQVEAFIKIGCQWQITVSGCIRGSGGREGHLNLKD